MMTIATILKKIRTELDWGGPNGYVRLTHEEAEYLHRWAINMCNAKDDLELQIDRLTPALVKALAFRRPRWRFKWWPTSN